jgi:hypothetical protein
MKKEDTFMKRNYIKIFGHVYSRCALQTTSTLKLDPHESELLQGVLSEEVKRLANKGIKSLHPGGNILASLSYKGELYVSSQQDIMDAFTSQHSKKMPHTISKVSAGGNDLTYITDTGDIYDVMFMSN